MRPVTDDFDRGAQSQRNNLFNQWAINQTRLCSGEMYGLLLILRIVEFLLSVQIAIAFRIVGPVRAVFLRNCVQHHS